ncbi:MAG TPA: hypothetical protein VFJ20_01730 [Gemmatimonadaceae bacterium]|nr:hypothetical protein [Gemmatimonadaceae bacterium]
MTRVEWFRRTALAIPVLCCIGATCYWHVDLGGCEFERQSIAIGGPGSFTSSQQTVGIGVGDSVRLMANGVCQGAGLHIAFGTSGAKWHGYDRSIVRLSPAADSMVDGRWPMSTIWAVGVAPGSTVVSASYGESLASAHVTVAPREARAP